MININNSRLFVLNLNQEKIHISLYIPSYLNKTKIHELLTEVDSQIVTTCSNMNSTLF